MDKQELEELQGYLNTINAHIYIANKYIKVYKENDTARIILYDEKTREILKIVEIPFNELRSTLKSLMTTITIQHGLNQG